MATRLGVDQRTHLHTRLGAAAQFQGGDLRLQLLHEGIVDGVLHINPVGADAGLAGIAVFRGHRAIHRRVQIGIIEHDEGRIAAQFQGQALDLAGSFAHQPGAHRGRTGEGDLGDLRVVAEFLADRLGLAGDNGETALGHARAFPSTARASADRGVCGAGFNTMVQPAASAGATLRVIMPLGKFHGVMAAQTPTGCFSTNKR